jgi:hypothetical protein
MQRRPGPTLKTLKKALKRPDPNAIHRPKRKHSPPNRSEILKIYAASYAGNFPQSNHKQAAEKIHKSKKLYKVSATTPKYCITITFLRGHHLASFIKNPISIITKP